jgi:hypothetical protein
MLMSDDRIVFFLPHFDIAGSGQSCEYERQLFLNGTLLLSILTKNTHEHLPSKAME